MTSNLPSRRCLYDVLGVPRDATAADIKKAFRTLALRLHPDKNLGNEESATELFREVQAAYETLTDDNERAWYDSHRDAIMRGHVPGQAGGDSHLEDLDIDLYEYFSSSCYNGFHDNVGGFYAVYATLFAKLDDEERRLGVDVQRPPAPYFGNSKSNYDDVNEFYNFWRHFSTVRNYSWKDKYDERTADDRYVKRRMQNENKKLRDKGRREGNEHVCKLVCWVRHRDPRMHARQEQIAKEEEEREANNLLLKKKKEEQLKVARDLHRKTHEKAHWDSLVDVLGGDSRNDTESGDDVGNDEREIDEEDGVDDSDGDDDGDDHHPLEEDNPLFCYICKKDFKSSGQMANHQNSKQHKKKLEQVRHQMIDEEARAKINMKKNSNNVSNNSHDSECEEGEVTKVVGELKNTTLSSTDDDDDQITTISSSKKKKKKKNRSRISTPFTPEVEEAAVGATVDDDVGDGDDNDGDKGDGRRQNEVDCVDASPTKSEHGKSKKKNKQQKSNTSSMEADASAADTVSTSATMCKVCGDEFPSRSKLFDHIKASGHAALKIDASTSSSKKKNK